ncbi:MAG: UPF0182 family membrane protein [Armatimonadota bacterium]
MDFDFDRMPKRRRRSFILWIILAFVLGLIVLPQIAAFVADVLWYGELGRQDVYWTMTWGRWLLGLGVGIFFFLIIFGNVYVALRRTPETTWTEFGQQLRGQMMVVIERTLRRIAFWASAVITALFAWGIGAAAAAYWPQFLLFAHPQRIGQVDPLFGRDIGFYFFRLPVWELITRWLFTGLLLALILTAVVYLATRAIRTVRGMPVIAPAVQAHLSLLLAALFVIKAVDYYLGRFTLLLSDNGTLVGAGYADVHARLPGLYVMIVVALVAAVLLLINIRRKGIALPIIALAGSLLASLIALGLYPSFVQRFQVKPNELALETPYLKSHIQGTRQAYGLDKVRTAALSPTMRLSRAVIDASPTTIDNVRLWDHRPLLQTFKQRQELRSYYQIGQVDIDRYTINGRLRQVMLAAREMNLDQIPADQQSWVSRHLIYTHGYGLVMSPVNTFDPEKGEPIYFISDLPPRSTDPVLAVSRPEIYFGELDTDYAVVKTTQPEFDYPDDQENATSVYAGTAGVSLRNPLARALLAMHFGSLDLLVSSSITPESRMIFRRQIVARAQSVAPFLSYDRDPYLVVGDDGRLYWMLDAYTTSTAYPYAGYALLDTAFDRQTRANYVRNSVKVVIDAYHGTTSFYLVDPNEPIARAWSQVFPGLFQPLTEMPSGLRAHVRYPEGMFDTLSEVYRRFHMTDPRTFYQQEDLWQFARESSVVSMYGSNTADTMPAYYMVMSLPGRSEPEYLLIRPYTPNGRQNMIGWLSARNDPDRLGDLFVYDFPKQTPVYGPEQIQARINQVPEISQAFSLWDQAGSRVLKGNLMVIPLGNTVLYVQPIYLQAEQSQIPELQRVIVADQQGIFMRRNLEDALAALTGASGAVTPATTPVPALTLGSTSAPPAPAPASPGAQGRAKTALEHYNRAQEALKRGDWATYGREMDAVRKELEAMSREK